jgi:hypothetical protein
VQLREREGQPFGRDVKLSWGRWACRRRAW